MSSHATLLTPSRGRAGGEPTGSSGTTSGRRRPGSVSSASSSATRSNEQSPRFARKRHVSDPHAASSGATRSEHDGGSWSRDFSGPRNSDVVASGHARRPTSSSSKALWAGSTARNRALARAAAGRHSNAGPTPIPSAYPARSLSSRGYGGCTSIGGSGFRTGRPAGSTGS